VIVRAAFLSVVFASGFAALVYQVIWQRLLTFATGAGAHSVTIIVATFMLGLGLGSLAGGHLSDRLTPRARLWAFAACELAIAAFALVSVSLFYDVIYVRFGTLDLPVVVQAALKAAATLWPTFFMGLSFPLAARVLAGEAGPPGRWVAITYGGNAVGAAAGALASVTVLLVSMDFVRIVQVAALVNLACAAVAVGLAMAPPGAAAPSGTLAEPPAAVPARHRPLTMWIAWFALSGCMAMALEVVWFRLLGVILKGNALTFGYLLAFYLGGLGAGALLSGTRLAQRLPATSSFLWLQAAIPIHAALSLGLFVIALEQVPLVGRISLYLSGDIGPRPNDLFSPTALVVRWVIPLWLMGIPTLLMGLSFGSLQRAVQTDLAHLGRRVGWLQAANIAGSTLGALITGFVLLDRMGTSGTLRLLVALGGVFMWLALREPRAGATRALAGVTAMVVVAVAAVPGAERLWSRLHGVAPGAPIVAEDSSGVALLRASGPDTTLLFANGRGQSQLPYGNLHAVLGALPAMLHRHPARVAVIGLGSGNTAFSIGGRPETVRIDSLEIIAPVFTVLREWSSQHDYPGLTQLLADPRMQHHFTDGRTFIARQPERYDLIEADARRPGAAYAGNLYSVEFFSLLRGRLNPDGLLTTWVPTDRVLHTLRAAFPHVVAWGEVAIASERPIAIDSAAIRSRMARPFTRDYYRNAGIDIAVLLDAYLVDGPERFEGAGPRRDLNRDLFPRDEFGPR